MAQNAPGKAHRKGLTLLEIADMFRDETHAIAWVESIRWPDGPYCPDCGSTDVQSDIKHPTMTHRCRACPDRKFFSARKGTIMQGSRLPYRVWAVALYMFTTNLKGVSSMKLHRDLGITQKSAWFVLARLRKAFETGTDLFSGPIEADETFLGGKRKNMSKSKRKALTARGTVGKTPVAGIKDRDTNRVTATPVKDIDAETLQGFVRDNTAEAATVYTDEAGAYQGLEGRTHETVNHSAGDYVRDEVVHTNGIESFWSMLKRGYVGTYHKMSPKHMERYVTEFTGRHNIRDFDTIDQMGLLARNRAGKKLMYRDLIADNGLESGARRQARR